MLSPTEQTVRLFLHVLAATVWVGGQLTLGGLVPTVRRFGPDATKAVARQFNRVAWPAFGVLIVTGIWNLLEVDPGEQPASYQVTLALKIAVVAASGMAAGAHVNAQSKVALAVGGAVAGVTALASLFLGILLRTGR